MFKQKTKTTKLKILYYLEESCKFLLM